jgi:hypothetical protein
LSEGLGFNAFTLEDSSDFLKTRGNAIPREPDVGQSVDVRESRASILKKDDRFAEAEFSLKQTNFMNYVLARMERLVRVFVLGCHDQERKTCVVEHLYESISCCNTCDGLSVELFPTKV